MARQFKEVWRSLDVTYDDFIQTSEPRHHKGCEKFIQKVFDNGHIYKGTYEGWYCEGCEAFKTDRELDENKRCPDHKTPAIKRSEPCYFFRLSSFRERLLAFYEQNPDFIQPETRATRCCGSCRRSCSTSTSRARGNRGAFGFRSTRFTIYVWFDGLNYITAIGYGTDERCSRVVARRHPLHRQGHHPLPRVVAGDAVRCWRSHRAGVRSRLCLHQGEKISKTLGNVVEPMDLITKFNADAFRYYFRANALSRGRRLLVGSLAHLYNGDLANNLGNSAAASAV
jgi:methionyl-tRNA synthetase